MKKLELNQMESISGESGMGCVGAVLGAVGLVAAFVSIPATGGMSTAFVVGYMSGAIGTGLSIGDCATSSWW